MSEPTKKPKNININVVLMSVIGIFLIVIGLVIASRIMKDEDAKTQKNVNVTAIDSQHVIIDNTLDNGMSTVYIKADKARDFSNEYVHPYVKELMSKKEQWQTKNPFKKIVAMTTLPTVNAHGYTAELGLLIHYEIVPPSARQIQDEKKPKKSFGHFGEFGPVQSEKTSINEGKK